MSAGIDAAAEQLLASFDPVDVDERQVDAGFADQTAVKFEMLAVFGVIGVAARNVVTFATGRAEFVFELEQDDRTAGSDQVLPGNGEKFPVKPLRIAEVFGIVAAELRTELLHEEIRIAAVAEFAVHERPHAEDGVKAEFAEQPEQVIDIVVAAEIPDVVRGFMVPPDAVEADRVDSGRLHHQQPVAPDRTRNAAVGEVARINEARFPADYQIFFFHLKHFDSPLRLIHFIFRSLIL